MRKKIFLILFIFVFTGCGKNPLATAVTEPPVTYEIEVQGTKLGNVIVSVEITNTVTGAITTYYKNQSVPLNSTFLWSSVTIGKPMSETKRILVYHCKITSPLDQDVEVKVTEKNDGVVLYTEKVKISNGHFFDYTKYFD